MQNRQGKYGIYVHCQSGFIEECRITFGDLFEYDGKRGIILDIEDDLPEQELRYLFSLALTCHLRKKRRET